MISKTQIRRRNFFDNFTQQKARRATKGSIWGMGGGMGWGNVSGKDTNKR
jgi:hypothetical protein